MNSIPHDAVLLLVDIQKGLDDAVWGNRNNPQFEVSVEQILAIWRETNRPIIHIRHNSVSPHSPLRPELPGNAFKDVAQPMEDEPVLTKTVNSAFIGTDLHDRLQQAGYNTLVIIGLTTNHCVSTTTRMAGNMGYNVYLISDATAAHDLEYQGVMFPAEQVHQMSLANIHGEFATVITTQQLLDHLES